MKKLFVAVTIACFGIILASITAQAGRLAFDAAGNLFVADGHSIFKFTPDGERSIFAAGLRIPTDLVFDSRGDLFVSDLGQKSIFTFTSDGKKKTLATASKVFSMVIDRLDNLYASDGDSILKFTPDGNKSPFATGIDTFEMVIDGSDNLYFSRGDSIFKFTPDRKESKFATVHSPNDMAFDGAGNLFVADRDNRSILKLAPEGTQSAFASEIKANELVFDKAGNLFVSTGDSIFKFAPDGNRSWFTGLNISPDMRWECQEPDDETGPKIVKAGTKEAALDLSDECRGSVDWSPNSKRFAFNCHERGRWNGGAFFYQLSAGEWKPLKSLNDAVLGSLDKSIAAQVKKKGLPKKTDLRLIWQTVRVDQWIDSNTAIVFGDLHEVVRENPETRFDVEFLFTLKFDEAGNWKIVKTHRMSGKEIDEHV